MNANNKKAARQLGLMLKGYGKEDPVVAGIMQGGVEIGLYIAQQLQAGFVPLIVQKLVYPLGKKYVFGAVAEDGSLYYHPRSAKGISQEMIDMQEELAIAVIEHRKKRIRHHYPLPGLEGRTIILVDDDMATGSTMMAAIAMCRHQRAARIIVAVPAAPRGKLALMRQQADAVVVLPATYLAQAIPGAFHTNQLSDELMMRYLQKAMSTGLQQASGGTATAAGNKRVHKVKAKRKSPNL